MVISHKTVNILVIYRFVNLDLINDRKDIHGVKLRKDGFQSDPKFY